AQCWLNLATLADSCGDDLAAYRSREGVCLSHALQWLSSFFEWPWPFEQMSAFDRARYVPLAEQALFLGIELDLSDEFRKHVAAIRTSRSFFKPEDGVRPAWNLRRGESVFD